MSILTIHPCWTQESEIAGTVSDSIGKPLYLADVLLTKDNLVITGTSTDNQGNFIFNNIREGQYKLMVSYIGYKTFNKIIIVADKFLRLKPIVLDVPNAFKEIVIFGKKPRIIREVGKVIFDVTGTSVANSNAWEIIKRTPGINIKNNEDISIGSEEETTLTINGKEIQLNAENLKQFLLGVNGTSVESIEILKNPGAEYDANYKGVINIVMDKKQLPDGNKSVIKSRYRKGEFSQYNVGIGNYYRKSGLSLNGSINLDYGKHFRTNEDVVNFLDDNKNIVSSWRTLTDRVELDKSLNLLFDANNDFDKINSVGLSVNLHIQPNNTMDIAPRTNIFDQNNSLDSFFLTNINRNSSVSYSDFSLRYQGLYHNNNSLLINLDRTYYDFKETQNIKTTFFDSNNSMQSMDEFQNINNQKNVISIFKTDYKIKTKNFKHSFGIKLSNIIVKSDLSYNIDNGQIEDILGMETLPNDSFNYDEANAAAYTSTTGNINNLEFIAGIRAEYTIIEGNSKSLNNPLIQNYLQFFPSTSLLLKLKSTTWGLNYRRSISRPDYSDLNPFRYFYNQFTFNQGDPRLQPSITFNISTSVEVCDFFVELFYQKEKNPIIEFATQQNQSNIIKYQSTNIKDSRNFGIEANYTFDKIRWFDSYIEFSLYQQFDRFPFDLDQEEIIIENSALIYDFGIMNEFDISSTFRIGATYNYYSPYLQGGVDITATSNFSITLNKSFLDDKINLTLIANDIFKGEKDKSKSLFLNQNNLFTDYSDTRSISVSLSWILGNGSLNNKENLKENLEEKERIGL